MMIPEKYQKLIAARVTELKHYPKPDSADFIFTSVCDAALKAAHTDELEESDSLLADPFDYHDPNVMWDIIVHRRDGDAVIFLAGDDRDYSHFIGVVWSPEIYRQGNIPHAII